MAETLVKMESNGITQFVLPAEVDRMKRAGYTVVVEDPKPEPKPTGKGKKEE